MKKETQSKIIDKLTTQFYYTGKLQAYSKQLEQMTIIEHITGEYQRTKKLFDETLKILKKVEEDV
jgi:hypothetical protein